MFFPAENPPFGTMITYYLPGDLGREVPISIQDEKGSVVRTLNGPGTAGIHRVNWDLKRQNKVTDAEATKAGVTTISEREALDWVAAGKYTVTVTIGPTSVRNSVVVRKETDGVKVGSVRK